MPTPLGGATLAPPSPTAAPSAPTAAPVTVARGDGIGPEIMDATLRVLDAAGARLEVHEIQLGEQVYRKGHTSGIAPETWDLIRAHRVLLKAPIATPRGGGYKSLNVTARKALGLFANVRPCASLHPFVAGHPDLDVVIVRENEEDTYAGIEHRQTDEVVQCLKLVSRPGCERVVRYAFEFARHAGRQRVTCLTKDNIMKMTDGLFLEVFREVARDYPELRTEELIVDIGAARLAAHPERFDVVVTPNLYGDIVSDVVAEVAGSVGLCGSVNVGARCSMFEAIHGSAPDIAGRDVANPSGLLNAAILMLDHLGQGGVAQLVHDAWLATIEDGIHTADVHDPARSGALVGTQAFADAVVARLGRTPRQLRRTVREDRGALVVPPEPKPRPAARKELVGTDVFVHWSEAERDPARLAALLRSAPSDALELVMITNRGVKVWPEGFPETFRTDHWRCRFAPRTDGAAIRPADIVQLLAALAARGVDFVKTEHLYEFDGERGYSLGQGQ